MMWRRGKDGARNEIATLPLIQCQCLGDWTAEVPTGGFVCTCSCVTCSVRVSSMSTT